MSFRKLKRFHPIFIFMSWLFFFFFYQFSIKLNLILNGFFYFFILTLQLLGLSLVSLVCCGTMVFDDDDGDFDGVTL